MIETSVPLGTRLASSLLTIEDLGSRIQSLLLRLCSLHPTVCRGQGPLHVTCGSWDLGSRVT